MPVLTRVLLPIANEPSLVAPHTLSLSYSATPSSVELHPIPKSQAQRHILHQPHNDRSEQHTSICRLFAKPLTPKATKLLSPYSQHGYRYSLEQRLLYSAAAEDTKSHPCMLSLSNAATHLIPDSLSMRLWLSACCNSNHAAKAMLQEVAVWQWRALRSMLSFG